MTTPLPLLRALRFAADQHRFQKRKDASGSPYINHPIAVATLLAETGGITEDVLLLAAVLHDTVEDTETTLDDLAAMFGEDVASLVAEVTDDKSLPKDERKELQVQHARAASPRAKQLKIADKVCNLRDVTYHPPVGWSLRRRREYFDWAERVVAGCRGVNPALDAAFDEALAAGRAALERTSWFRAGP
ncbi:MAG: bifunctional (p)ppGpp synthetase/guanosine-3',5'-bis(diphosphate) 3'-pyrophosphohydrolase [Ignavibacteria bacterium]|nr:bifunctional (p)ppGpp synthetase/guanosine-3',5'-bis(diphosphate) 3'-pyrophosphohydrolase [Ignavibacteria bacterium]